MINVCDDTIEIKGFHRVTQYGLGGFSCITLSPCTSIKSPADFNFGFRLVGGSKQNPPEKEFRVIVLENRPVTEAISEVGDDPLSNECVMTLRV